MFYKILYIFRKIIQLRVNTFELKKGFKFII